MPHGFAYRLVFGILAAVPTTIAAGADAPYDGDPIRYGTAAVDDPVARLDRQLRSGRLKLDHNDRNGYLESVLKLLNIPASSQSLVFSKTSFQRDRISPASRRALYFDDDTYVS